MKKKLTASLEDYLEAIAELCDKDGHAHTKLIADKLNVKMPSVTGALRQLTAMNYIIYNTHYPVELTPEGRAAAEWVTLRHRVLKTFLSEILGLSSGKASETACSLEHSVDREIIERFTLFSKALSSRKDAENLRNYLAEAVAFAVNAEFADCCVLSELAPGRRAEIVKAGKNADTILVEKYQLTPGRIIALEHFTLDQAALVIVTDGKSLQITPEFAENIWVKPL